MPIKCPKCGRSNELRPNQTAVKCSCGKSFKIRRNKPQAKSSNQIEKIVFKKNFAKKTLVIFNCPKCSTKLNELVGLVSKKDACPECRQVFQFGKTAWEKISYKQNFVDRESLGDLQTSKERSRRIKQILDGNVRCQWIKDSNPMFSELQSVDRVSADGKYVFFPSTQSGVPIEQVVTENELAELERCKEEASQKEQDSLGKKSVESELKDTEKKASSDTPKPNDVVEISIECGTGKNTYLMKGRVKYKELPLLAMCCHKCKKTTVIATQCSFCGNHSPWRKRTTRRDPYYVCAHCDNNIGDVTCGKCGQWNTAYSLASIHQKNYSLQVREKQLHEEVKEQSGCAIYVVLGLIFLCAPLWLSPLLPQNTPNAYLSFSPLLVLCLFALYDNLQEAPEEFRGCLVVFIFTAGLVLSIVSVGFFVEGSSSFASVGIPFLTFALLFLGKRFLWENETTREIFFPLFFVGLILVAIILVLF